MRFGQVVQENLKWIGIPLVVVLFAIEVRDGKVFWIAAAALILVKCIAFVMLYSVVQYFVLKLISLVMSRIRGSGIH